MPNAVINLIKGDSIANGPETDYRDALMVNMYAVNRKVLGVGGYLLSYPGLTLFGEGSGVDRGANYNERFSNQFRVSGEKLIEVSTNGTVSDLGSIPGSLQSSMPYSFNTQCVIVDGKMFLYDSTAGFREVTDPDLGEPIDGVWVDGYYFLTDGEFIYHTDINDESSIDPLKFATAEFMPDKSLGVGKTQDNKVIVFGRYSLEYFVNAATDNFAFQRVVTRAQKIGIVATHAKCESGGAWYIVGGRKGDSVGVHIVGVGDSTRISTREIEKVLAKYTEPELSDIRVEARNENDIGFILFHLPNETVCFNTSVASSFGKEVAWSILKSDVAGDAKYRAINGVFDARIAKWVYGDKINSNIGLLDNDISTQYGEIVEGLLFTPFTRLENMSIDEIDIDSIPGHTMSSDATVAISITYDGLTYGKEWFEMYGLPNDYEKRFIIRRLGHVREWFGLKIRVASTSRVAFGAMQLTYG